MRRRCSPQLQTTMTTRIINGNYYPSDQRKTDTQLPDSLLHCQTQFTENHRTHEEPTTDTATAHFSIIRFAADNAIAMEYPRKKITEELMYFKGKSSNMQKLTRQYNNNIFV